MAIKAHPNFAEIRQAIQKLSKKGRTFSGVCYRCTESQFAGQFSERHCEEIERGHRMDLFVQHSDHHAVRVHRAEHFPATAEHHFSMDVLRQDLSAVPQTRAAA